MVAKSDDTPTARLHDLSPIRRHDVGRTTRLRQPVQRSLGHRTSLLHGGPQLLRLRRPRGNRLAAGRRCRRWRVTMPASASTSGSMRDFVALPSTSQWLYIRLLTSGELSYCGVADWRPGRIAASAVDLTAADVEMFAQPLEDGHFIITDRATEEVLVRSFVKHDGLMDKWNLAAAMAREFTAIASQPIRGVVAHELGRPN